MVRIIGREMRIPESENSVGFVGDNGTETREFEITDSTLFDFNFKLDLKVKEHTDIADLEKRVEGDRLILQWNITSNTLQKSGMLFAQIRAFKETGEVWRSEKGQFWVLEGMNTQYAQNPVPSEFEQIEQQVTLARNETIAAKDIVLAQTNEIAVNTQTVSEKTEVVLEKTGIVENNTEIVAQNTELAESAANIAAQAMSDLLEMLGSDIATLTDGKLTPTQIPALSISDVFEVANTEEMLLLAAQRGDIALIVLDNVVSDSYILGEDAPHILNSWKKIGVNYVANSGHALTATNAQNAEKINNHRLVIMEETQYSNSVTVDGTVYLVFPDGTIGGN